MAYSYVLGYQPSINDLPYSDKFNAFNLRHLSLLLHF